MGGCYIWGAGKWGKITKVLVECLGGELEIKAFVDSKKTGYLDGIRIIKKEEMELKEDTIIFIAFTDEQWKAVEYLEGQHMKFLKNVFIIA